VSKLAFVVIHAWHGMSTDKNLYVKPHRDLI